MPTVYLETTIPSYLAAKPSRDLVYAAHQQITNTWWTDASSRFELVISEAVIAESMAGDPDAAARRMKVLESLTILQYTQTVNDLIAIYDQRLGLPARARGDLPHFAFAVAYEVDYLLTWNCKHIANGESMRRLLAINSELGHFTPLIVTPEELLDPSADPQTP